MLLTWLVYLFLHPPSSPGCKLKWCCDHSPDLAWYMAFSVFLLELSTNHPPLSWDSCWFVLPAPYDKECLPALITGKQSYTYPAIFQHDQSPVRLEGPNYYTRRKWRSLAPPRTKKVYQRWREVGKLRTASSRSGGRRIILVGLTNAKLREPQKNLTYTIWVWFMESYWSKLPHPRNPSLMKPMITR